MSMPFLSRGSFIIDGSQAPFFQADLQRFRPSAFAHCLRPAISFIQSMAASSAIPAAPARGCQAAQKSALSVKPTGRIPFRLLHLLCRYFTTTVTVTVSISLESSSSGLMFMTGMPSMSKLTLLAKAWRPGSPSPYFSPD